MRDLVYTHLSYYVKRDHTKDICEGPMYMSGSGGRTASHNTVFATLAKMDAVRTRRKYPQRYVTQSFRGGVWRDYV